MLTRNAYIMTGYLMGSMPAYSEVTLKSIGGNTPSVLSTCYGKAVNTYALLNYMGSIFDETRFVEVLSPSGEKGIYGGSGVVFGDGNTEPTIDDLTISGNFVSGITTSNTTRTITDIREEGYWERSCLYTITNTTSATMTINEIAMAFAFYGQKAQYYNNYVQCPYIVDRTVLEAPVVIEPGGIGQVTYTIRMNYPTA